MYMPYVMYAYAITVIMLLLGCVIASRTAPGMRGVRPLQASLLCGLTSIVLLAFRPYAPAWLTIVAANQILFVAPLLLYCSAARILNAPMAWLRPGILLCLGAGATQAFFTWSWPDLVARILVYSGYWVAFSLLIAFLFFRYREDADRPLDPDVRLQPLVRSLAWLEVSVVVLHSLRCVLTLLYRPASLIHLDLIQGSFNYLNLVLGYAFCCGLLWLSLCVQHRDFHSLAHTDSLTGLLNRRAFEEVLDRELRRAACTTRPVCLLLLDIDRFKDVNDNLGHHAGDEVLRRFSETLCDSMRTSDTLVRYGGEEFVLLLREVSVQQAQEVAERLCRQVAGLSGLPGAITITTSIGVGASQPDESAEAFLRRCDEALYRSKHAGRNRVTVYPHPHSPSMA